MARRKTSTEPRPAPPPRDLAALTWVTGLAAERGGMAVFTHLIRAPGDPERQPREATRDGRALWRRKLTKMPSAAFRRPLLSLLASGPPRTFNALGVELLDKTSDVLFQLPPDVALWWLVEQGFVEHTMEAPILFRATPAGLDALVLGESALGEMPEGPSPYAGEADEEGCDTEIMGEPAGNTAP